MAEDKTGKAKHKAEDAKDDDNLVINDSTTERAKEASAVETDEEKSDEPDNAELKQAMDDAEAPVVEEKPKPQKLGRKLSRKKIALIVSGVVVLVVGILFAVPATRYAMLGAFIKRNVTVTLLDSKTSKPVSSVAVAMAGQSATTDAKGVATLTSVPVGSKKLTTHKKYYKDLSVDEMVGVTGNTPSFSLNIEATGRQVPVKVINKISQQPVEGADLTADGTSSKTGKNGEAVIVLPADKSDIDATVSLGGYNNALVKITITEQKDDKNTFAVVPSGKLYFLSKRSGAIDVMKSDLDGANAQTVVKGTGKEDDGGTVLLASRDWKYLALLAKRDSDRPKLYLVDTATSKLSTIDEGDVAFTAVGWYNNYFVFNVSRDKLQAYQSKQYALKSYDAKTGQLNTLDETVAAGSSATVYAYEVLSNVYILNNELVYVKDWQFGSSTSGDTSPNGKYMTLNSVRPDGSEKKVLKSFFEDNDTGINSVVEAKPQSLSFYLIEKGKQMFWEYEDGKMSQTTDYKAEDFFKPYPTYLVSPSGNATFWYESRDGKHTLLVGDGNGNNGKEIATLSDFVPYGWYGDDYLLVSKGGSELYIISRSNSGTPLKVTDYHKPQYSFYGYGYGYGGF